MITTTPPAKPKPTAQTVLKCLGFATYSAYWLAYRQQHQSHAITKSGKHGAKNSTRHSDEIHNSA